MATISLVLPPVICLLPVFESSTSWVNFSRFLKALNAVLISFGSSFTPFCYLRYLQFQGFT